MWICVDSSALLESIVSEGREHSDSDIYIYIYIYIERGGDSDIYRKRG